MKDHTKSDVSRGAVTLSHRAKPSRSWASCVLTGVLMATVVTTFGGPFNAFAQQSPALQAVTGSQTRTDRAGNGVPVVQIATPNAQGISHNQYTHYNVGPSGQILNNSHDTVQTQLGGYIVGNTNLQPGQSARIIINEVTSANASQLRGYLEVAGPSAEVIVANPNGITCAGCGFINTTRGVLTTGQPVFGGDGSLAAFRVNRGRITVEGDGLDAPHRIDLLARAVELNAGLWANEGNVVTGANRIDYASLATQAIAGEGAVPGFGLDVAALGGMYAEKIRLVGTEGGVGVRSAGELIATGGDFILTSAGDVRLTGRTAAAGDVIVDAAGQAALTGRNYAEGSIKVAGNGVVLGGDTWAGQGIDAQSRGDLGVSGTTQANAIQLAAAGDIALAGTIQSAQHIAIHADGSLGNSGMVLAGGNLQLDASDIVQAQGAQLAAQGRLDAQASHSIDNAGRLIAGTGLNATTAVLDNRGQVYGGDDANVVVAGAIANGGLIGAGGNLDVNAGSLTQSAGAELSSGEDAEIVVAGTFDNAGRVLAEGALTAASGRVANTGTITAAHATVDAGSLSNQGAIHASQVLAIHVSGRVDNAADARLTAGQKVALEAAALVNAGQLVSDGDVVVTAASIDNANRIEAARRLAMTTDSLTQRADAVAVGETVAVNATGAVANAGRIHAIDALSFHAGSVTSSGIVYGGTSADIVSKGALNNAGTIASDGALNVRAQALKNAVGGVLSSADVLTLAVERAADNAGSVYAQQGLQFDAGSLSNSGSTYSGGSAAITVRDAARNSGSLVASQALQLDAGDLHSTGELGSETGDLFLTSAGTLSATGKTIAAGRLIANAGGTLHQAGQTYGATGVSLTAQGDLRADGTLDSGGDIALDSGANLVSTAGIVTSANVDLEAAGTLSNAGDIQAASIHAQALQLDNSGRLLASGDVSASGQQSLSSSGTIVAGLRPDGSIAATGTVTLGSDGTLDQSGTVYAGHAIDLRGGAAVLNRGQVNSGGDLHLSSGGGVDNTDGSLSARDALSLQAQGGIDNTRGHLTAAQVQIEATDLGNAQGEIVQSGATPFVLDLSGTFDNSGGRIAANADTFTVSAGDIDNAAGRIEHVGTGALRIVSRGGLDNADGLIVGNGTLGLATAESLDNSGGTISGVGTTEVSAGAISNTSGVIAADGQLVIATTGVIDNRDGALVQRGVGTLSLSAARLDNRDAGLVGAAGSGTLDIAGELDNSGGTLFAQNGLTATAGTNLLNRAGTIQSGGALTLDADGTLDNTDGQIDATGATRIDAGALANVAGRIVNDSAGALNVVVAGRVDNRGGVLGNSRGDAYIQAGTIDNRSDGATGGRLIAGRDLHLESDNTNNRGGLIYAERDLTHQTAGATIDNTGGELGAGSAITVDAGILTNTSGRIVADTVALNLDRLDNGNGDVAAYQQLTAQLGRLTGSGGRLFGHQRADIQLSGNYTHDDSQHFESNGQLALSVDGDLTNAGTLESAGALTIAADALVNTSAGHINSSNANGDGQARVEAARIDNAGRIEGDGVTLVAADVANTGTVIGNRIRIEADRLVNGRDLGTQIPGASYNEGFIGATERVDLRVSERLDNLDAELYSLGDLSIAGRANGTRTGVVRNASGRIQAEGDVAIAARQLVNERRLIELQQRTLTAAERAAAHRQSPRTVVDAIDDETRAALTAVYQQITQRPPNAYLSRNPSAYVWMTEDYQSETAVARASAESQIKAGGDITLDVAVEATNRASRIAAGRNLVIDGAGAQINNIAINRVRQGTRTNYAEIDWSIQVDPASWGRYLTDDGNWRDDYPEFGAAVGTSSITDTSGTLLASTITAGQAVVIDAHNVNNTGVAPIGTPGAIEPGTGWTGPAPTAPALGEHGTVAEVDGSTAPGTIGGIATGPTAGTVDGGIGGSQVTAPAIGGTGIPPQVIGTPEHPLPNLTPPTGRLFTLDPDGRYLIESDPRFANYGNWLGSDYLLDKLGYSPDGRLKRLGDDFYEQWLVLEQITGLTGRKYLAASNGLDQYRALMDAGADVAGNFGLSVGIALTAQQVAALDQDIVWLVEQVVSGQKVLVPVVYLSQASAEKYRLEGAAISAQTVAINATGTLNNRGTIRADGDLSLSASSLLNDGGDLSAGGVAYLAALDDVVNRNGQISGGQVAISAGRDILSETRIEGLGGRIASIASAGDLSLSAGRDLSLIGTQVKATGQAALNAGRDLTLSSADNTLGSHGALATAARTTVDVAGNLGLSAGRDLGVTQSSARAGGHLVATAGRDLSVTSAAGPRYSVTDAALQTSRSVQGGTRQDLDAGSLSAGQNLVLSASQDVVLTGAILDAGEAIAVQAGRDISATTVTTTDTQLSHQQGHNASRTEFTADQTTHGTQFTAAGDIAMQAGQDISLTAATAVSEQGGIALSAVRDVNLLAAQEEHAWQLDASTKKSGTLSSTRTTTHDKIVDSVAVGTMLSGETVAIAAGRDVTTIAAQVAGTGDVVVAAGRNLTLDAGRTTRTEAHSTTVKKSGLMGTGGIGVIIGSRSQTQGMEATGTQAEGTLLGSIGGSVTLVAGQDVTVRGSDVLSATGTTIVGQNVTIESAEQTLQRIDSTRFEENGLKIAIGGGVADGAMAVYYGAKRANESDDDRVRTLSATQAGYKAYDSGQQAGAIADAYNGTGAYAGKGGGTQQAAAASGINLRITASTQTASSQTVTRQTSQRGSSIESDGDVNIVATTGDLTVTGSHIAGQNVTLDAANELILQSAQDRGSQRTDRKSGGGEIGVAIAADQSGGAGAGLYVAANASRGKADGDTVTHAETTVQAANTLTLRSGGDTTVQGAQLRGETVLGRIGGDLRLVSEQDTDDYRNDDAAVQGSATIGFGFSGQASISVGQVDSDYASVTEQTGIAAGEGGFDLFVGGDTTLIGAGIVSSADPANNRLSTRSLTVEDIRNEADYNAYSLSVSTSGSVSGKSDDGGGGTTSGAHAYNPDATGGSASPGIGIPQNEDASSTTRSAISAGTIEIRDGDTTALADLDRSTVELQQTGLKAIFDEQEVRDNQEAGQLVTQAGFRAAGYLAAQKQEAAMADLAAAQQSGDQAAIDAAMVRLDSWSDGGANKAILHGLTGAAVAALGGGDALQGALGAAGSEKAKRAMSDYLTDNGIAFGSEAYDSLMELGSLALGGIIGDGSGAATALTGDQYNRQLHPDEVSYIAAKADDYAELMDISQAEAEEQLLLGSLLLNDDDWAEKIDGSRATDDIKAYEAAFNWLAGEAAHDNLGFVNENGQLQQAFTSTKTQYGDGDLFSDPYKGTLASKSFDWAFGTDLTSGHSVTLDNYDDALDAMRFQSQFNEWLGTKPADLGQWSEGDWVEYKKWHTEDMLRGLSSFGFFGGVGQLAFNLTDGNYDQVVEDAALSAVGGLPIKTVDRVADAVDAVHDANKLKIDLVSDVTRLEVAGGKTCLYSCIVDGVVRYVGITDDIAVRGAAHLRQKGIIVEEIQGLKGLSREDARAVEQVLIEFHGLGKNGGDLINKINSISSVRSNKTKYEAALLRGSELLRNVGYGGF